MFCKVFMKKQIKNIWSTLTLMRIEIMILNLNQLDSNNIHIVIDEKKEMIKNCGK